MTEQQIKLSVIENADIIAKTIHRGKDVEIRKSSNGVSIAEISKKVLKR